MTWLRCVVPGTAYLLTRHCTQRRFLLVPRGVVPKLFGYCVALAAERHGSTKPPSRAAAFSPHSLVAQPSVSIVLP
jgi:hypothetical protein